MVSFDGGSASKVDDVTALPSRHKMADMCYYGNVMTTTRWWLRVTILHLQQYSHRLNFLLSSVFSVTPCRQKTRKVTAIQVIYGVMADSLTMSIILERTQILFLPLTKLDIQEHKGFVITSGHKQQRLNQTSM